MFIKLCIIIGNIYLIYIYINIKQFIAQLCFLQLEGHLAWLGTSWTSWTAWAGLVYLFHFCNILGCNILGCLGYLIFFFLDKFCISPNISSRPVYSLVLIWDIMESMSCFIWSFQYISSFTPLLALVAWFTHLSRLACFTSFKRMVHSSVSKPSLGKSYWMVGFWNIFSIFWLNSSSGTG